MAGSHDLYAKLHEMQLPASGQIFKVPQVSGTLTEGYMFGWGDGKPTDADSGWAIGAIFISITGADGTNLFVNDGTVDSCDFNLVVITGA